LTSSTIILQSLFDIIYSWNIVDKSAKGQIITALTDFSRLIKRPQKLQ